MRQLTQCLVSRSSGRVDLFLSLPVGSDEYGRMSQRMFGREGDECLSDGEIGFPIDVMRGSLFEAVYLRDYRNRPLPDFAAVPPINYAHPYGANPEPRGLQAIALVRFGDCVARADGEAARGLVLSIPGSAGESALLTRLSPRLSACLPKDREFQFSKTILRGALAEALVSLSKAAQ